MFLPLPNIKYATSIVDYIFRLLAMEYLGRHDLVQVPPIGTSTDVTLPPSTRIRKSRATDAELFQASGQTEVVEPKQKGASSENALSEHLGKMMGDAPFCSVCGHVTVRNGACYKCLNCGNSMGCS
jgi:ribonucleoside-diphosphate reductase alpha chain